MNLKYNPYLFIGILILIAISIGSAFVHKFSFPDPSWPLKKGDRVVVLPGEVLEQKIVANRDGLRKIEVLFGKFTLEGDAELTLEVRDSSCNAVLVQKALSKQSFDSEYTHAFIFDRIPDSEGQTYCFRASFVTNQPIKKEKAPRFFLDEEGQGTPYSLANPGGEKTAGAGPIAIRPGYTNDSFFKNASELFDRISQYKPVFLKSWYLIVFATLGLLLTLFVTVLLIREEEDKE